MTSPSITEALFVAITLSVASILIYAVLKIVHSRGHLGRGHSASSRLSSYSGWWYPQFSRAGEPSIGYSPLPAPGLVLIGLITFGTAMLAFSAFGSRIVADVPLAGLVGYQVFRVPLEWVLHELYSEGVIPVQMTYAGRNFDVVTGVLAAALGLWLWAGHRTVWLVVVWNILGLALLVNIVTIAILSTPVPFRVIHERSAEPAPEHVPLCVASDVPGSGRLVRPSRGI